MWLDPPRLALLLGLGCLACTDTIRYAPSQPQNISGREAAALQDRKLQRLLRHFVRQQTLASCSVAAATTVLGAVAQARRRPGPTQAEVLASDPSGKWAADVATENSRGIGLDRLGLLLWGAFYQAGIRDVAVDVVHVAAADALSRDGLLHVLRRFARPQDDSYLIINFLQSTFLADGDAVGHMAVLGAWDAAAGRALILDVDCRPLAPYWVPLEVLLAGMSSRDSETGEPRGYLVIRGA